MKNILDGKLATKTINLNSRVNKSLKKGKREEESFSETTIRLVTKSNIKKHLEMFGSLENEQDYREIT